MEGVVVVYFRESPNGRSVFFFFRESPNGGSGCCLFYGITQWREWFLFFLGNHPMEGVVVVYFRESPNGGSGFCFF